MELEIIKEYKLKGERNNRPRQPLIYGDKIFLIFVYDKKGFTESKIQCLSLDRFELIWEYQLNHVINNILISSASTLLASCMNGMVLSFNLDNGQEVWKFKTEESNIGASSNEHHHKIVISGIQSRATSTWCLDVINGNVLWKQPANGHAYIPKIHNEYVYNSIANDLFCLHIENGLTIWKQNEPSTYLFNPKIFGQHVIASGHGLVCLYDLKSGQLIKRIETGERSSIREIISDEANIYFGDEKGFFYSYNISNDEPKLNWRIVTNGSIQTVPAFSGRNVLFLNNDSKLFSVNSSSGAIMFEKKIKGEGEFRA